MKDLVDHDWSVTVWGAKGAVSIEHEKAGVKSGKWPLVTKQQGATTKKSTPVAKATPGSNKKVKEHVVKNAKVVKAKK